MSKTYPVKKCGTIDIFIVEANPVVFKGELYRFEYIRWKSPEKRYPGNDLGISYFRFVNVSTGEIGAPFGHKLHMGNAFVWEDAVYVTAVEDWGGSKFYIMKSDDMVNWSEPKVILEDPSWQGYNTSMCRTDDSFLLTFELGAPVDIVGVPFTMFFAESDDLENWRIIPDAVFGQEIYTGGPMLRYFDKWYYFFYLDGSYESGFEEYVVRSRDLKKWEWSSRNPVMTYNDEDRKLAADFSPEDERKIAIAENINVSDLDMCEWRNKLYMVYSWGNQRGTEYLAEAEAECTEQEFCESFF